MRKGPYRFLRHPNYLVVAGEILVLPLVFGETAIADLFLSRQCRGPDLAHPPGGKRVDAAPGPFAVSRFILWLGFLAMCLGLFMAVLDIQVVASALTTIGAALHVPPAKLGWIQTGYLVAEVIAIPLTGLLTRALSLRGMFVAAVLGFTLASLGCALAPSIGVLIGLRVIQGFCGGMLIPAVFTSIFVMMPESGRSSPPPWRACSP